MLIQLKKWVTYLVLEIIYKLYARPHLDYGDILYHIANTNKNKDIFELASCVTDVATSSSKYVQGSSS